MLIGYVFRISMEINMSKFYGREYELSVLERLLDKKTASLVVIKGRRRIGKSSLITKFAEKHIFYKFEGIAPQKHTTAQTQRDQFSKQLQREFGVPIKADDWLDLLWFLADKVKKGRIIVLLDEISWMGDKDHDFLGKLKNTWDNYFKENPQLILILCGSVSTWIDKNILTSTGFAGRISIELTLQELPLYICNEFWGNQKAKISSYEKFKILSTMGGIPKYLEEINPKLPAEENIKHLCFEPSGILFRDFEQTFPDIMKSQTSAYKKIVSFLAGVNYASRDEIADIAGIELGGLVSEYLQDLESSGFIAKDQTWHVKSGTVSKLSHYRLKDNYMRFYLKYILPNKHRIESNMFKYQSLISLPAWESIMGLQFENLVINNRDIIFNLLQLNPADVIFANPFFQRKTSRQLGCQIDFMVQTKFQCIYVCEVKFSKYEVKPKVITEVQQKIDRLKRPKGFSYRTVLIHVNGVSQEIIDREYFTHIISFDELFYKMQ